MSPAHARVAFEPIDSLLLDLAVPTDEWDILYRLRLQIERDLLVGAEPGTDFPGHEARSRDGATARRSTGQEGEAMEQQVRVDGPADQAARSAVG